MPIVRVEMWPGRTHEQKQDLAKAITDAVVEIGKAPRRSYLRHIRRRPKGELGTGRDPRPRTSRVGRPQSGGETAGFGLSYSA